MADTRKIALGIGLAALAAGTWWVTHRAAEPTAALRARAPHQPDFTIEDFVGNAMDAKGVRQYRLTARQVMHYPDDDTTHFSEPVLVQYLPGGVIATTRADSGVMPDDASEIVMIGHARATRTAGNHAPGGEVTAERLRIELER